MAENHYVDPGDQRIAAEGVEDHSELSTLYMEARKETLGPWMQEEERQKALEDDRDNIAKGLRKSSFLIGLYIGIPIALGIVIGQIALTQVDLQENADAMAYIIGFIFAAGIFIATLIGLFKWIGKTFQNHAQRALPITVTTIVSVAFLTKQIFAYTNSEIGGTTGYITGLAGIIGASIIIAVIAIFFWTAPKVPALIKLLVLAIFLGGSIAVFYLIKP